MSDIPKVIHYCWFGGKEKPELALKCIESWKKNCKEYEIKEWNESNYDIMSKPLYVQHAYENKKWAFVSDYARFDILFQYGGLYFDTDVEMIKPLDDILANGSFMGCERDGEKRKSDNNRRPIAVNAGLGMGATSQLPLYREILADYANREFILEQDKHEQVTVVKIVTDILVKHGLKDRYGIQKIGGVTIYPTEYFSPITSGKVRNNTYTIHHYAGTWLSEEDQKKNKRNVEDVLITKRRIKRTIKKAIISFIGEERILNLKKQEKK